MSGFQKAMSGLLAVFALASCNKDLPPQEFLAQKGIDVETRIKGEGFSKPLTGGFSVLFPNEVSDLQPGYLTLRGVEGYQNGLRLERDMVCDVVVAKKPEGKGIPGQNVTVKQCSVLPPPRPLCDRPCVVEY